MRPIEDKMLQLRVSEVMTRNPITIKETALVDEALFLMDEYGLRHLPVMAGTKLVGIISERDIAHAYSRTEKLKPQHGDHEVAKHQKMPLTVLDAMTKAPYVVDIDSDLKSTLRVLEANRLGSAIVKSTGNKIEGIITLTDVARTLANLLEVIEKNDKSSKIA